MVKRDENRAFILVVDDNPTNLDVLVETLQVEYQLSVAKSGKKALEFVQKYRPHLILLDIMMPEMDGFQVCEILKSREITRSIPIIFITALQKTENITKAFEMGAVDYITKPFNPTEVNARIKNHIKLIEYRDQLEAKVKTRTRQLEAANNQLLILQKIIIQKLGKAGEYKDNETGQHVLRVSMYAGLIAQALGLPQDQVDMIKMCAPMHDVGKIGIPDNVLLKRGPLDADEWKIMKSHCQIGKDLLTPKPECSPRDSENEPTDSDEISESLLMKTSRNIAAYHHERWDGEGYPNGIRNGDIPIEARIVSAADIYDAVSSKRPYKEAFPEDKCRQAIHESSGRNLEPDVVDAFFSVIDRVREIKEEMRD